MFSFLSNLINSVLETQVSKFIKQGFLRLGKKLKSNKPINKILWYFIELRKCSKSYWNNKEVKSNATHYLKLTNTDEWWRWELLDKYCELIKGWWMPYHTQTEAISQAKKDLKWFELITCIEKTSKFRKDYMIYTISAPHLIKKKSKK